MIKLLKNLFCWIFPPAPPEWKFLQRLYTDRYVRGENDCSNMAADYTAHCWQNGYRSAHVIVGLRENPPHHAWVKVKKGVKTWYVDPSSDKWTTRDKWARWYHKTIQLNDDIILTVPEYKGRYYKRDKDGEIVEAEQWHTE